MTKSQRLTIGDLWGPKPFHRTHLRAFIKAFRTYDFWFPNREQAPWHLQAKSFDGVLLNFYPHLLKAHADGDKCVVGIDAMRELFLLEDVRLIE